MAFNINAQVVLTGPKNIRAVTNSIRQQLGNLTVNVNIAVPKNASKNIQDLRNQMAAAAAAANKYNKSANQASASTRNLGKNTRQASNAMQTLGKETALTFKRFAAAGLVTGTVFRLANAIGEATGKALEFERELTKIQQVTGATNSRLSGLKNTADDLAKSLGLDANEIISVGRVFAQTGQTLDQVEASLRAVARASLAPSFGDMANTAEGLIAALAQFNIQASQSEAVLASINAVSKRFAVESEDIIGAIRRTGGVFAIAATDAEKPVDALNQLIAIFTSVRSTTRESAETIATGLRTIFSRIQRPQTIEFLKSLNINLTDAEGNFVGLFSAFRILSSELDGIIARGDTLALSRVVEELGGIRQVGKLIPAIREFRKAESAFAVATEGAVAGLGQDVQTGLNPLIKTFEQLGARFDSFIRKLTESATFEAFAKTIAGVANAFLALGEALIPILPALTALAGLKIAKGIGSFATGFLGSASAGGGMGGAGAALGNAATGGRGGAAGANSALIKSQTTAIAANTKAVVANNVATNSLINILRPTLPTLASSLSPLTQSIANLITAMNNLGGRLGASGIAFGGRRGGSRPGGPRPRGFARGGLVPGSGNRDTVPAMLTPGEFVIRKSATQAFGADNLAGINKYTNGTPKGRGVPAGKKKKDKPDQAIITIPTGDVAGLFLERGNRSSVLGLATKTIDLNTKAGKAFLSSAKNMPEGQKLSELTPDDQLVFKFGVTGGHADETAVDLINNDLVLDMEKKLNAGVKDVAEQLEIPKLTADAQKVADSAMSKVDLDSLKGHLFEALIQSTTGAALTDTRATYDFANLTQENIAAMNKLFSPDLGSAIAAEAKKVSSRENFEKDMGSVLGKLIKGAGSQGIPNGTDIAIKRFASGGMASGTDTVPALLTPGEFVINKKSAQSFGYGNLKDINKYAAGGIVRPGKNNYGTPSASNVRVAGGAGGATVNTSNINKNLNNTSKSVGNMNKSANAATGGISRLADTALMASFAIPGLIASFDQFDGTIGGTTSGLLNMAVNLALLIPAIGPVARGLGATAKGLKGFGQGLARGTSRGLKQGMGPRAALGRGLLGGTKGGVSAAGGGKLVTKAKDFAANTKSGAKTFTRNFTANMLKAQRAAKPGAKLGVSIGKGLLKMGPKAAAGLPGLIGALVFDPLVDLGESAFRSLTGNKQTEIGTQGVKGVRGGSAAGQGAISGVSGAAKGAALGAAIGSVIPIIGTGVGAIIGGIVGGVDGFFKGAAAQIEFEAFEKLNKSVAVATTSLNELANAQKLGSGTISSALNNTDKAFADFDSAFKASQDSLNSGFSFTGVLGGAAGGIAAGVATGGNPLAVAAGARLGAGATDDLDISGMFDGVGATIGAIFSGDFMSAFSGEAAAKAYQAELDAEALEVNAQALDRALESVTEEFTAAVQAANQNLLSLSFDEALNLDSDALSVFEGVGVSMEQMADGSKRFSGENETFVAALQAAGDETGRAKALITSYNQAVRASALQLVKSEREAAKERLKLVEESGGDTGEAEKAAKESAQLGLAIQNLGDSIGTADPSQIEEAIRNVGGVSGEASAKIKQQIMEQQVLIQEETRRMAAEKALAAAMAETQREIEALGEGLKKLDAITAGGVARFNSFASNFEADFDRAFGSDAKLTVPSNFNPFENIDASSADEIADGLERIKGAIGDTAGGPNEGATAGFQELLKSTQDLPFATKSALEDLQKEGNAEFASPDAAVSAVLGKLDASGAGPTGAARDVLASNLRKAFVSRQGEGGTVALESDLIEGVIDQVNTAGEQLKTTLANVTNSLNEFRAAQLRVAQISIEIAKKQQQAALKTLDIRQRADDMLGINRGRDPRAVAQGNLDARLGAIQTNVAGAGVAGVGVATTGEGLLGNLSSLEAAVAPLREAVEAGSATDAEIAQLAAVEQALSETKQALDTLADDTTRLSAIQDRLTEIEKRKMSAQDRLFTVQAELAKAMEEGDLERVAELQKEIEAPRRALAKAQAGEALTLQESTALQQGIPQLVTEGLLTDEQAAKLRDQIAGGLVGNADFMNFMGGSGNINGRPAAEFLAEEESLGGGAKVTGETSEEARLRAEGLAIAQEQQAIVAERTRIAEESLAKRREQMIAEMVKAEASFEAAGAALKKLRGEANLLVTQTGGAGGAPVVPDGAGDTRNIALLSEDVGGSEVAALAAELTSLRDQIAQGMNVNLNGNQNVNITDAATAGKVFEQAAELTTAAAFANKVPQLEQQFTNSVSSQMNTLG
ncbi:MAG: phage tail tape measure protein [Crocinitomicaceae bacterium]|nr:phage tail tape measure protein [Crocinitomicaceae bacterium]